MVGLRIVNGCLAPSPKLPLPFSYFVGNDFNSSTGTGTGRVVDDTRSVLLLDHFILGLVLRSRTNAAKATTE